MSEGGGNGTLRELLAVFSFGVDTEELKKGEAGLGHFFEKVEKFAKGIAGLFLLGEIKDFVNEQAKAAVEVEHLADKLGISGERVNELRFASQALGLSSEELLNSVGRLQVSQAAAAAGSKLQSEAFASLGVKVKDANGHMKSADDLFFDVADGIGKMQDPAKQAAAAVHIFGRAGRSMLPMLKEGRDKIGDLVKTFHDLGGGFSKEGAENAKKYVAEQAKVNLTLEVLKEKMGEKLIPIFTKLMGLFERFVIWVTKMTKGTYILESALGGLATVATFFALRMALANAPLILLTVGIGLLLLAIEDFVSFMSGKDSVIGRIFDKMFGKGTSTTAIDAIKDAWKRVGEILDRVWETTKQVFAAMGMDIEKDPKKAAANKEILANEAGNEAIPGEIASYRTRAGGTRHLTDSDLKAARRRAGLNEAHDSMMEGFSDSTAKLNAEGLMQVMRESKNDIAPGTSMRFPNQASGGLNIGNVMVKLELPAGTDKDNIIPRAQGMIGQALQSTFAASMADIPTLQSKNPQSTP